MESPTFEGPHKIVTRSVSEGLPCENLPRYCGNVPRLRFGLLWEAAAAMSNDGLSFIDRVPSRPHQNRLL
jgi:hypothetical protein